MLAGCGPDVNCPPGTTKDGLRCVTVDAGVDAGCPGNHADCDELGHNGCETALDGRDNCGECGYRCADAASCNDGVCSDEAAVDVAVTSRGTACAALANGDVYCWGDNSSAATGLSGADEIVHAPVRVPLDATIVEVAAGAGHICARSAEQEVYCWGENGSGEVGTGSPSGSAPPTSVPLPRPINKVVAGGRVSCAIDDEHQLFCWGALHDPGATVQPGVFPSPVLQELAGSVTTVAVRDLYACAVRMDASVICWGALGDDSTPVSHETAVEIGIDDAVATAVGTVSACALQRSGAILCWGGNRHGQLGDGTMTARGSPATVTGLDNAIRIAVEGETACTIDTDAQTYCWGDNATLIANPSSTGMQDVLAPRALAGLPDVSELAVGNIACVVAANGSVVCWGMSRTPSGTWTYEPMPVPIRTH